MFGDKLARFFRDKGPVLVAYSGGIDSSVLAKAAYDALGEDALAVTFDTPTITRSELALAKKTAKRIGIRHVVERYSELWDKRFRENPGNRCYFCKKKMAERLRKVAGKHGIKLIVEGTNAEDLKGERPGYKALKEAGISSPLAELGFTKNQVRALARRHGLNWDKPSSACLASRIPTGKEVTYGRLRLVEDAEECLKSLGIRQVRVRLVPPDCRDARIEVEKKDFKSVLENAEKIRKSLPFRRISLDLSPYS